MNKEEIKNISKLNGVEYKLIKNDYFTHVEVKDIKGNKKVIPFIEFKEIINNLK